MPTECKQLPQKNAKRPPKKETELHLSYKLTRIITPDV